MCWKGKIGTRQRNDECVADRRGWVSLYYILNNYGPAGAVYNSSGQAVNQSYWDTWFGPSSSSTVNAAAAGSVTATLGSPSATSGTNSWCPTPSPDPPMQMSL